MRIVLAFAVMVGTARADKVAAPKQPAIPAATAALIPDTGWLVATHTDDELVITRITRTGPKELWRSADNGTSRFTWIDGKTLARVVVDYDKNIELTWIVDGVLDPKRTVKHAAAAWGRKADAVSFSEAYRTPDGGIWLEHCIGEALPDCNKSSWVRIDTATSKSSRTQPAKVKAFGGTVEAPTVKAPAGYAGKLVKIKSKVDPKRRVSSIECTGPKGKMTWSQESPPIDPAERFTPKQVRWILASPPLFEVAGTFENPVGQTATRQFVFRECVEGPYEDVSWIGPHAWSHGSRDDRLIHVLVDDAPVALLVGGWLVAAPAK